MKHFFFCLLFIAMITGCKSSEKSQNKASEDNLAERVDYDQMAPEAVAASIEFIELSSRNGGNLIKFSIVEVLKQGRNAPSLNEGQEIELSVDPNLYSSEELSEYKTGDSLTAVLEYQQQGGLGQTASNTWKLISITK